MNGVGLLRSNKDYRNLWIASTGSVLGSWFSQIATLQVVLSLTHSPTSMAALLLCGSLPGVILGPFVGPLVDHFPKKVVLLTTDFVRTVLALLFSLSVWMHAIWILYVASTLMGVAGIMFGPARGAVIPLVVRRDELAIANGFAAQNAGVMKIVGASLGGILTATIGPVFCFVIDAASYLWSAVHILKCRWDEPRRRTSICDLHYFQSLKEGFQEALHNRVVRSIIIIGISWGLAGGGFYIIIPILGQQVYHMGGFGIGVLYVIDGLGVLIGASVVNQYAGKTRYRATVWYGVAYITQAIFFGVLTQFTLFVFGAFMLLLMRISSGIIIPIDTYMLQISTDQSVRGRVFALHGSTYGGVMQLSFAIMGLALSKLGIPVVGIIIGTMSLLCGLSWLAQFNQLYDRIGGVVQDRAL